MWKGVAAEGIGVLTEPSLAPTGKWGRGGGDAVKRLAVSTGSLSVLPRLHGRPIDLVVYQEPTPRRAGDLILQRVSRLYAFSVYPGHTLATQRCR
jgi:hypothetical protein